MNYRLLLLAWGLSAFLGTASASSMPQQSLKSFQRAVKTRVAKDQAARIALVKHSFDANKVASQSEKQRSKHHAKYRRLATRASDVDAANVKWLKQHVAKFGLPNPSEIGADTTERFFVLLVHADRDREFQKKCVELMESAPSEWQASYVQRLKFRASLPPPLRIKWPEEEDEKDAAVSKEVDWETIRLYLPDKKLGGFVLRVLGFGD